VAGSIYSTRFLLQGDAAVGSYSYLGPSGFVVIVRDVDVVIPAAAAAGSCALGIDGVFFAGSPAFTDAFSTWSWRGRQVLEAGETLQVGIGVAGCSFCVSGYLLST
jgi:hypothetical protein